MSTSLNPPAESLQDLVEARERFLAGESLDSVRPVVLESWRRSATHGLSPYVLPQQVRDERVLRAGRARCRHLVDCAEAPIRLMHDSLGGAPHLIALSDEHGLILRLLHSAGGLPGELEAANLFEGASWHERDIGSNGIGTCLATGGPVLLIGPEHYQQAYVEWTCIGVPLRDGAGNVVGALDLSVPSHEAHPHTWGWTLSVAEAIQYALSRWIAGSRVEAELAFPPARTPLQTVRGVMRFLATRLQVAPTHERYLREAERQVEAADAELQEALSRVLHSERKARQDLAEIEALYATAPVGLCVLDGDLRFVRINDRLAAINGMPAADHIGRTVAEALPGVAKTAEPVLRRVLETGEPLLNVELSGMTPAQAGVMRHWREHFVPLRDHTGRVFGIHVVAEEVTQQKQAEAESERLHAATKRALAQRDEVLAIVSHDMRNPLNTIGMAGQLLVEPGLDDERRQAQSGIIKRCVSHLTRLIEDLLDVARIEGGGLGILRVALDAKQLVGDAVEAHRPAATAKGISLVLDVACTRRVSADRERILQVFNNLIVNALHHTSSGGTISIEGVDCEEGVCFSVSDTGEGLEPEHLPHVFDRFWQAAKHKRAGAGLGLAISRGIVEAHSGRIWVESEGRGSGATFRFTLPGLES